MSVSNPVALVTGGAKRVGRAISLELARAGYDIAVHFRESRPEAESLAEELSLLGRRAEIIHGELADPTAWPVVISETVNRLGRLDVLINNASQFSTDSSDTLERFDLATWERMLRVNLTAPVALCHYAARHLAKSGAGCIVNLCDISIAHPWPDHLAYEASKAALATITKALARALAPSVRVNGVALGIAVFPESYSESFRESLVRRVPLGRAGTPEDVAGAVRFLVESAPYVTGEIIAVDGGRSVA